MIKIQRKIAPKIMINTISQKRKKKKKLKKKLERINWKMILNIISKNWAKNLMLVKYLINFYNLI
jgi:hypothetical protein